MTLKPIPTPTNWKRLLPHAIAMAFPSIESDDRLQESMRDEGFDPAHPIVLFEGKILDGRNRHWAAKLVNVEPVFMEFEGTTIEAIGFSMRANLFRRHLTTGQQASIAFELGKQLRTGCAAETQTDKGLARAISQVSGSKRTGEKGVSARTIEQVAEVSRKSQPLYTEIKNGKLSPKAAIKKIKESEKPKAPPKPSAPTDEAGVPIHPRAKDALGAGRDEAKRIVKALNTLKREALAYAKGEYGRGLHAQTIETDFENIARQLRFGAPYSTCPLGDPCDEKCKLCRGTQWITESSYDGMPSEFKRKAG